MFDELRYRWALRKYLKEHQQIKRSYDGVPDDSEGPDDEPRYKHVAGREVVFQETAIGIFRSKYLIEEAYRYYVPVPSKENDWIEGPYGADSYLSAEAAQKLRADIRAEQKADWEYWANRVTLALALIGSIFGVLAFFKK